MLCETIHLQKKIKNNYIIKDVSMSIPENSIYTLAGPNGSGKSTLLKLLTKMQKPTSGEILFKGTAKIAFRYPHCLWNIFKWNITYILRYICKYLSPNRVGIYFIGAAPWNRHNDKIKYFPRRLQIHIPFLVKLALKQIYQLFDFYFKKIIKSKNCRL